jgi:hypothetical protein
MPRVSDMIDDVTEQLKKLQRCNGRVSFDVIKHLNEIMDEVIVLEREHDKRMEEKRASRRKEHREEHSREEHTSFTYHDPNETD